MSYWSLTNNSPAHQGVGDGIGTTLLAAMVTTTAQDTKTAWVEITPSTDFAYEGFWFYGITDNPPGGTDAARTLIDIAVGAGGSEQIIMKNLYWGTGSANVNQCIELFVPLRVPSGSRLSVRMQCIGSSSVNYFDIAGIAKGNAHQPVFGNCITLDLTQAELDITTGRKFITSNTLHGGGAFVSLGTFPQDDIIGVKAFLFAQGGFGAQTPPVMRMKTNIAIGASGSQVNLVEGTFTYQDEEGIVTPPFSPLFYKSIYNNEVWVKALGSQGLKSRDIVFYGFF